MNRKLYLSDDTLGLYEYLDCEDDVDCYNCWNDEDTQDGYNHKMIDTFEKWRNKKNNATIKSRFISTIVRLSDHAHIGSIFVSPENTPPDLAILIYKSFRELGYGTAAFMLGTKHCFETLKLDKIHAGCYPHNIGSMKILKKAGFVLYPKGNMQEKHYLTGEKIIQLDFVKFNHDI